MSKLVSDSSVSFGASAIIIDLISIWHHFKEEVKSKFNSVLEDDKGMSDIFHLKKDKNISLEMNV